MFKKSLSDLKKPLVLTSTAMYIALYAVLYSIKIPLALESRVTLTFLPIAAAGYLMGPVSAMAVGAIGDILGCLFFPAGQYFPGFTISALLNGLIFGVFLYKRKNRLVLCSFFAVLTVTVAINLLLNTLWLAILYQKAFWVFFVSRVLKEIVSFPFLVIGTVLCINLNDRTGITKYYA